MCIWGLHSTFACEVLEALTAGALLAAGRAVLALLAGLAEVGSTVAVATVLTGLGASTPAAT